MRKFLLVITILLILPASAAAQDIAERFRPACDSLSAMILERSTVKGKLELKKVLRRKGTLDFYFNETLGDFPWRQDDIRWFRKTLKSLFPECYSGYSIGEIYSRGISLDELVTPGITNDGKPFSSRFRTKQQTGTPLVEQADAQKYPKGLSGRHIALWQSHGRYYEQSLERWEWQRPCLFQTVEDMMSAGFVLQYLVPMLENAGAYVMLPRERDTNTVEVIVDNDHSDSAGRTLPATSRSRGKYLEWGQWETKGTGYADTLEIIYGQENPFRSGTSRSTAAVSGPKSKGYASASWVPEISRDGEYAVYVSYVTASTSTEAARYTVRHAAGETSFIVNQKMGGGTWVYLGTFHFRKDGNSAVTLDNATPKGHRFVQGSTVSADAVRFGGGTGNIARHSAADSCSIYEVSGLPRYTEGARYWLQWAGADSALYSQNCGTNDYKDDYMCRGDWVGYLSGGSSRNMDADGKKIPVDLACAFHSDAGVTPNDSTVGTLSIYTLSSDRRKSYPSGGSRMAGREYADVVQSQIVSDMRMTFDKDWNRRSTWDRGYRESRTPPVPTVLLESFSHQNFADMRYALDPSFRFTLSRAIYKGILKFMSNRYGVDYAVQPLPVRSFAVSFTDDGNALLSWRETADTLEPTAAAKGYILYTRVDDGVFDQGRIIRDTKVNAGKIMTTVALNPGHIYSFRIAAFNDGGRSFPSETLSIGQPTPLEGQPVSDVSSRPVLIVNNFTRVSAPAWFDTPQYAGFDNRLDSGVPYIRDISFLGEMYQFRRGYPWLDDDNPGFGASYQDYAGKPVAGNTFDYAYIHGQSLLKAGFPFFSASAEAFVSDTGIRNAAHAVDLICGKQVTTPTGGAAGRTRYTVFTPEMQRAVREVTGSGKSILVSGSHIGTDIWDKVYPVCTDSTARAEAISFAQDVLGFRWRTNHAGRTGRVRTIPVPRTTGSTGFIDLYSKGDLPISFRTEPNSVIYSVETPDGIEPAASCSRTVMRYTDTGVSAGTCYDAGKYKAVCIGFPLEVIEDNSAKDTIFATIFEYLCH